MSLQSPGMFLDVYDVKYFNRSRAGKDALLCYAHALAEWRRDYSFGCLVRSVICLSLLLFSLWDYCQHAMVKHRCAPSLFLKNYSGIALSWYEQQSTAFCIHQKSVSLYFQQETKDVCRKL